MKKLFRAPFYVLRGFLIKPTDFNSLRLVVAVERPQNLLTLHQRESYCRMLAKSIVLLLSAGLAAAHFQMQFPIPRGPFVEDDEPTFCGISF